MCGDVGDERVLLIGMSTPLMDTLGRIDIPGFTMAVEGPSKHLAAWYLVDLFSRWNGFEPVEASAPPLLHGHVEALRNNPTYGHISTQPGNHPLAPTICLGKT